GLLDENPSDGARVLLAAVQRDVHAAGGALLARSRHKHIAFIAHAQRVGDMTAVVAVLIEALDAPAERPKRAGTQGAIDVLENDAGLIVVALIDERTLVGDTGVELACGLLLDHEGMSGTASLLIEKIPARFLAEAAAVKLRRSIGDARRDDRVVVAVEEIDFLPFDVVERVDRSGRGL